MLFFLFLIIPAILADSNADDTKAMNAVFFATGGPTTWPPAWRVDGYGRPDAKACQGRWLGITCHRNGRIAAYEHRSGYATGVFPPEIALFQQAHTFDMSYNKISGTFPDVTALGITSVMTVLSVSHNRISGTIPNSVGTIKSLRFLLLEGNAFTGTIPASVFALVNLEGLFLASNQLEGMLPETVSCRSATHIRLHSNPQLTGNVGKWFLPYLLWLEAQNTQITVPIGAFSASGSCIIGGTESHAVCAHRRAPMRFTMMGDFGTGGQYTAAPRELSSAQQLNEYAELIDSKFTLSVGDNFYTDSVIEVFFRESFEALYTTKALQNFWYPAYGNHDIRSQIPYTQRSTRWRQPNTYFNVSDIQIPGTPYTFDLVVPDTASKRGPPREMNPWLVNVMNDNAKKPNSRYTILMTHYPTHSSGCHKTMGRALAVEKVVAPYKKVTMWVAGHDHHMEIGQSKGVFHVMTGAFSRGPCVNKQHPDMYYVEKAVGGFSFVTLDAFVLNVTFVNQYGVVTHVTSIPFDWRDKWETWPLTKAVPSWSNPISVVTLPVISSETYSGYERTYTTGGAPLPPPPPPRAPPSAVTPSVTQRTLPTTVCLAETHQTSVAFAQPFPTATTVYLVLSPICSGELATFEVAPSATPSVVFANSLVKDRLAFYICLSTNLGKTRVALPVSIPACATDNRREDAFSAASRGGISGMMLFIISCGVVLTVFVVGTVYRTYAKTKQPEQPS